MLVHRDHLPIIVKPQEPSYSTPLCNNGQKCCPQQMLLQRYTVLLLCDELQYVINLETIEALLILSGETKLPSTLMLSTERSCSTTSM